MLVFLLFHTIITFFKFLIGTISTMARFEGGVVERPELNDFLSQRRAPGGLIDLPNTDERSRKTATSSSISASVKVDKSVDVNDDDDEDDFFPSLVEHGAPKDGIYAELKLSDRLLDSLHMTKEEKINLTRRLYSSEAEHQRLESKLTTLQSHKVSLYLRFLIAVGLMMSFYLVLAAAQLPVPRVAYRTGAIRRPWGSSRLWRSPGVRGSRIWVPPVFCSQLTLLGHTPWAKFAGHLPPKILIV